MTSSKRTAVTQDMIVIEVRRSAIHGQGVFAQRDLRQGQVIGHYTGSRFAPDECHPGWNDRLTYLFGLSDGSVIDGAQGGNATRFINHACEPNVEAIERHASDGELSVVIRTKLGIPAGAELFLDYALVIDGDDPGGLSVLVRHAVVQGHDGRTGCDTSDGGLTGLVLLRDGHIRAAGGSGPCCLARTPR